MVGIVATKGTKHGVNRAVLESCPELVVAMLVRRDI
jgi:hypothetical protein